MKLSFSTKGWHNSTFEDFCDVAESMRFGGIELHNIGNKLFTDKNGAFHDYSAASTLRLLYEKQLTIPCIDTICDVSNPAELAATFTIIPLPMVIRLSVLEVNNHATIGSLPTILWVPAAS